MSKWRNEDRPKVYLAGPEVFLKDAISIGKQKKELCEKYYLQGLFPFDNEIIDDDCEKSIDHIIYLKNRQMMLDADFCIVNLTPFRGPSADVGSVFELGMMAGMGKGVFGYSNVTDSLLGRMQKSSLAFESDDQNHWIDINDMSIENFSNSDNLMIDVCLRDQGHPLVTIDVCHNEIYRNLTGFEICLQMIARLLENQKPKFYKTRIAG